MPLLDNRGRPVRLGNSIGQGGEGTVYEIADDATLVAKIYHKPLDSRHAEKLSAMTVSSTPDILKFAAWPLSTVQKDGRMVGLVMRKLGRDDKAVHELYTPKSRIREYPGTNWAFLVHVAGNVARGFATIHSAGHVIGDVNHGNILVSRKGTTGFIDCDSFQVQEQGRIFLCEVGVPPYTPPELQKIKSYASVRRTPNHDAFGLAVLVFHLLFMGRHPFAGRFSGSGEMPIERAITECRFAFGSVATYAQMSPPPNSLLLSDVPPALADAFERAFSVQASQGGARPSATEWLSVIEQTRAQLTRCSANHAHVYYSKLPRCPWCSIEGSGIILFLDITIPTTSQLNVEELWRKISSLRPIDHLEPIPTPLNLNIAGVAKAEWRANGRKRRASLGIGIAAVVICVWVAVALQTNGILAIGLVLSAVVLAYFLPREAQQKRGEALKIVNGLWANYKNLQVRYARECGADTFANIVRDVSNSRSEYALLPTERQRRLQELERNKYQLQLYEFLDRISIHQAKIPLIGEGRKHMLASYGVDSAADITLQKLYQVPNFGGKLTEKLMNWRGSQEKRFRFDPSKSVDKLEIERVNRDIRARQTELEKSISSGVQKALATHASIRARRQSFLDQMESLVRLIVSAEANYKAS